jgi:hypothetical protein
MGNVAVTVNEDRDEFNQLPVRLGQRMLDALDQVTQVFRGQLPDELVGFDLVEDERILARRTRPSPTPRSAV